MIALLGIVALQTKTFDLSSLDLTTMTNGWSRPGIDRSISGGPISIKGQKFAKGIGAHAPARLDLLLSGATSFDATVGVDDATLNRGSVEFHVVVDGREVWKSGTLHGGEPAKVVHVDLTGAKTLSLRATDGGDGTGFDHADWAEPRITTAGSAPKPVRDLNPIRIETAHAALGLYVSDDGQLYQRAFGARDADESEGQLAFPTSGNGWTFDPALEVSHADGNTSTDLRVVKTTKEGDVTRVEMKDPQYPFSVDLCYRAYSANDVIETWTEIRHQERGPVTLQRYASSSPDLGSGKHWLTQFRGVWEAEGSVNEEPLTYGIKTLDSKLGVRSDQFLAPWFLVAKGTPAKENEGEVVGGSLAWSGSFAFDFEVDPTGRLRSICGVNPYASAYVLKPGVTFQTPKMVWSWSGQGAGALSRNLHQWLRTNVLRDGERPRSVLLNNWEATYFKFDEAKITSLFDGAKDLGMELFLLDDGWFGKKYPRDGDTQGLGDWMPDPKKFPRGLGSLTDSAHARGLRFGLWFEPEMVSPRSELFEKHPNWAIQQPKRELQLQRNQLILDLSNPEVKEYVFQVVDRTLRENPGIGYVKWDCNRFITQPGSSYLGPGMQSNLWVDYVRALYEIFGRVAKQHPTVEVMMCSGGGGRVDYGAMHFAHELWPSDMTDPAKRIFIQWGFSYFYPPMTLANHVTLTGAHGMKYAFDVAMSGRLGMDVDVDKLSVSDRAFAKSAIATYKSIRDVVQLGDEYRLESPYDGPRSALMDLRGTSAVVFVYSIDAAQAAPLPLRGLDPTRRYRVREVNLAEGTHGMDSVIDGGALARQGLALPAMPAFTSHIFTVEAQ